MAEGLLFNLAGKVIEGLASIAGQDLALPWGFKRQIDKLKRTAFFIQAGLRDVEEQHNSNNHQISHWLEELKDVLRDVEDLLDDFSTEALRQNIITGSVMVKEVRLFFTKSNKLVYAHRMGHRVKAIRRRLDAIADDRAKFQLSDHPVEPTIELKEREQAHSFVPAEQIIGRDDDRKKIVELLLETNLEQNVSVVPIVGIGGLGKTTLAGMVFNDENVIEHFELRMWATVSEKFELNVVVEKIIEAATQSKPEKGLQMETLKNLLGQQINGRKYLLVLDDVWNDNRERWRQLKNLLLGGSRGSWIVLTTRSGFVADITRTVSAHVLEGLSEAESWCLLKQVAFKEQSHDSINSSSKAIGMEIAKQCQGVPLALRAIGRVLFGRSEEVWSKVGNNVLQYITQEENGVLPILRLSYNHLPPHLKQCFAYCSIFPKGIEFEANQLIMFWMALGFILPLNANEDLEGVGQEYFHDLLWRCFFQVAEKDDVGNVKCVTMHDLMHDLASSIVGTECCIASLEAKNVSKRTLHITVGDEINYSWEIPRTLLTAYRARTFLNHGGGSLNQSMCDALISSFEYLRILDLGGSNIERLSHSIGNLKHLRTLILFRNENIRILPDSLCRLQNLQTLDLNGCDRLEKLPSKTSRLVSLRHLYIDDCHKLAYIPRGLRWLTCLRTLTNFIVGKPGREVGQLRELNGLNKLQGKLHISCLQNAIPESGPTYLKDKLNLKSLKLSWREEGDNDEIGEVINVNDEMVLECLQPYPNLKKFKVSGYSGSKFSKWFSSITSLTKLKLEDCDKCKHLPPLHQLCSLKFLRLRRLKALEYVSENELSSAESAVTFLPSSLEELFLINCPNLKRWWKGTNIGDHASNAHLPCFSNCLSNIWIIRCPLTSMPRFPSVKRLLLADISWKLVQQLIKLTTLESKPPVPSSSSSSSAAAAAASNLHSLHLSEIEDLDSLPEEFLQNLTSLQSLFIFKCLNLTSMSERMRLLNSLKRLEIGFCPQLSERCKRDTGVDWPNIAHIEAILIDGSVSQIQDNLQQKFVLKVIMHGNKSRSKTLKSVASTLGVESVSLKGADQSLLEVIGSDVNLALLVNKLRQRVGYTELLSVGPVRNERQG